MQIILDYFKQTIDEHCTIEEWNPTDFVSIQLAEAYQYYMVTMLSQKFLLVKPQEELSLLQLKRQIETISNKTGYDVAILIEQTSAYMIKKMFEERMAFVINDKQLYLPFMAMHIRDNSKKKNAYEAKEHFTASTQLIYLFILYMKEDTISLDELVPQLKISKMTALRGCEELNRLGLISYNIGGKTGRKKVYTPIDKKDYFKKGKSYLIKPIKKSVYVRELPQDIATYKSGLTALAEKSMIVEPEVETYAIYANEKALTPYITSKEEAYAENLIQVQCMCYDVGVITKDKYVDLITMMLSLDEIDERIEKELNKLMEDEEWYAV